MKSRNTIDFAKAVPFFLHRSLKFCYGGPKKIQKTPKSQRKSWEAPDTLKDFLWDFVFFEFFLDIPNTIWSFCQKNGTALAKSMVFNDFIGFSYVFVGFPDTRKAGLAGWQFRQSTAPLPTQFHIPLNRYLRSIDNKSSMDLLVYSLKLLLDI